jgi:hypothetical protein
MLQSSIAVCVLYFIRNVYGVRVGELETGSRVSKSVVHSELTVSQLPCTFTTIAVKSPSLASKSLRCNRLSRLPLHALRRDSE